MIAILLTLLIAASPATAQNLVVQDVKIDQRNSVIMLRNDSGKVITGFTLSVTEVYPDGSDNQEFTEDYGSRAVALGQAFNPNEEKQETVSYGRLRQA